MKFSILVLLLCIAYCENKFLLEESIIIDQLKATNENVVIGIFTQPSDPDYVDYPSSQYSYLAASYVKFVEMAGARVVPIPYEASNDVLEKYFLGLNGVIIPGGASDLDTPTGPSKFAKAVAYFINRALQVHADGEIFPVFGICMGFQTLHYIISGYKTPFLIRVYDEIGKSHSLDNGYRQAVLYKDLDDQEYSDLSQQNVLYYSHNWAVTKDHYSRYPSLQAFFRITGTNVDSKNVEFIASVEAKEYPILGVQYHPEKNIFEWKISASHTKEAIKISANQIDAFMNLARQSSHQFTDEQLSKALIYNFKTVKEVNSSFVQVYFFKNGEVII